MSKLRVGHKENSYLNGEWVNHVDKWLKRWTAKKRRRVNKKQLKTNLVMSYNL